MKRGTKTVNPAFAVPHSEYLQFYDCSGDDLEYFHYNLQLGECRLAARLRTSTHNLRYQIGRPTSTRHNQRLLDVLKLVRTQENDELSINCSSSLEKYRAESWL
jgi:hypothetical protein